MSHRPFNAFAVNQELEALFPQDLEARRQTLLSELKSKMEATETKYQKELQSQAAIATKKAEVGKKSTETLEKELAKAGKTA
jgi:hypothetical protein